MFRFGRAARLRVRRVTPAVLDDEQQAYDGVAGEALNTETADATHGRLPQRSRRLQLPRIPVTLVQWWHRMRPNMNEGIDEPVVDLGTHNEMFMLEQAPMFNDLDDVGQTPTVDDDNIPFTPRIRAIANDGEMEDLILHAMFTPSSDNELDDDDGNNLMNSSKAMLLNLVPRGQLRQRRVGVAGDNVAVQRGEQRSSSLVVGQEMLNLAIQRTPQIAMNTEGYASLRTACGPLRSVSMPSIARKDSPLHQ